MKYLRYLSLVVALFVFHTNAFSQNDDDCPTGLDIHIANDISGSVDATEYDQSKNFITQLGISFAGSLGTANDETRISISNWASADQNEEYNFPIAGPNYTTELSDIISFQDFPRPFSGGTDLYEALLNAFNYVNQNPIAGRDVPKLIIILTDAFCSQVTPDVSTLATQLKAQGIVIVLLAVDEAATCEELAGTNVASEGGYFAALSYNDLQTTAVSFIQDITDLGCDSDPPSLSNAFDLDITLDSYQLTNCNPGPATGTVNFTINNLDFLNPFNDNLFISFYDGDPTQPGTQFLFSEDLSFLSIPANGGSVSSLVSNPLFLAAPQIYAIVNFDGSTPGNEVPISISNLSNLVVIDTEEQVGNNISSPIDRVDEDGCDSAVINVQVTNTGVGCDDQVFYTVQICNNGNGDAIMGFNDISEFAPSGFNLIETTVIGDEPYVIEFGIGPEQIVSQNVNLELRDLFATDLNGDGHVDVIAANFDPEKIGWYANDGTGNFGPFQPIPSNIGTGRIVHADDLDNDGDQDIIAAGDFPNEIVWFENDGAGNFAAQQIISSALNLPQSVYTADLDGDGDQDVISAFIDDDNVVWFENDGTGNFGPQQVISTQTIDPSAVYAADLDGDNDIDVISTSAADDKIAWYANDGSGNFGAQQIIAISVSTNKEVYAVDLNGDGSNDIVANGSNQVTWFANDGLGNFGAEQFISNTSTQSQSIFPIDFDQDGDLDVLSSAGISTAQSVLSWFENDGTGNFGPEDFITGNINRPRTIIGADMDSDGDFDVLSMFSSEDKIVWYENLLVSKFPALTCVTYQYEYNITGLPAGDYDYTVDIDAEADAGINPFVLYTPSSDFSFDGQSGLNGFEGISNTSDDISYDGVTVPCVPGEQILVDVSFPSGNICPEDFIVATITINNQNGLTLNNTLLTLDLSGAGSLFNSEPYNITNGLVLAEPNTFDPNYPNVPNAIAQQNGPQTLDIFTLPGGVSTFEVNILVGTDPISLLAEVSQIPLDFNQNGNALDTATITPSLAPVITGTCPPDADILDSIIQLNYSVTNGANITWNSGTNGSFTNPNSGTTDYNITDDDRANGYVDLSLQVSSAGGCLASISCRVDILGGLFDYGDAPISYDLNESAVPVAAGALINQDIFLGSLVPGDESTNQPSVDALADGPEEDALSVFSFETPAAGGTFTFQIDITNNSAQEAYTHGYLDWDNDGGYLADPDDKSLLITVPPSSGTSLYDLTFDVPDDFLPTSTGKYLRIRISTDELAANVSYGTSANGEVEDYLIFFCTPIDDDIVDPTPISVCTNATGDDLSNETFTFDLTQKNDEITQSNPDFEVLYYETQADLDNDNPIATPDNYTNTANPQTLIVEVTSISTGCEATTTLDLVINVFPNIPATIDDLEECDEDGDGLAIFNLTSVANDILVDQPNFNPSFYLNQTDANNATNAIDTPSSYNSITSPQTIWIRIENQLNPNCFEVASFQIIVSNSDPINLDIDPLVACDDDNDGFFNNFDLTSVDDIITLGNPDIVISYHLTSADAVNNVGALSSPYANVVQDQQEVFFRAVDINNGCEQFGSFLIQVVPSPLLTPITEPLVACDDDFDGTLAFDLTQIEAEALGSLDPTNLSITYHTSLVGAQTDTDLIPIPTAFENTSSPQSIWIKVVDTSNPNLCFDIEEFEIIVEALPIIVNPEPLAVCDDDTGGDLSDEIATFDLNDVIDEITLGNNELNVQFFETEADLIADNPITPIDAYVNLTNPQTLEVLVSSSTNGCSLRTTLTIVVDPLPTMAPVLDPIEVCDPDNDGFAEFDLQEIIDDILNNEPEVTITFHLTAADAELGVNPIDTSVPFGTTNNNTQTIYVRAENTGPNGDDGTGCFDTRPLDLIVVPSPEIANLIDLSRCDDESPNGFASFDLTVNTPEALGSQDPNQVLVTYHETQADAEAGTNAIAVPSNYTNITNPQIIYVRIFDNVTGCVDLFDSADDPNNTFTLTVEALPEVFTPAILNLCDDDYEQNPFPQVAFDLTVKEPEIVGQTVVPANFTFTYYASQDDLDNGIAITDPTAYVNQEQPQTIFITVVDTATENNCFSTVQMTINVLPLPSPSTTDPDVLRLTGCDDDNDGVAINPFDLTLSGNFIAGSENVLISYYLNESGAIAQDPADLIADPATYINDPALNETDENGLPTNVQIIYARVDNNVAGNFCFVIVPFELVVFPNPELNPLGDPFAYTLCADDETNPTSATLFSTDDITGNLWDLNGGSSDVIIPLLDPNASPAQNLEDFNVTYHTTEQDAEDGINAISPGYLASDGEILFIRVTNIESGCFNTTNLGQVQIVIEPRPNIAPDNPADLVVCADDFTESIATLDLTQYDDLINPGSPANTVVVYYEGQMNYDNGIAIEDPVNYTTIQTPQTIIAEVINTLTGCESSRTLTFDVIVNPLLGDISSFDGVLLCVDAEGNPIFNAVSPPVIDTGLSENNFSFAWALDGIPLPDTTASITPLLPGVYSVVVTNTLTGCQASSSAEVIANQAIGFNVRVITPAFSVTHVAEIFDITGSGDFEFQLDDGPWIPLAPGQTTVTFTNLSPGTHTITGRDQGGCGEVTVEFMVIDYPPFFTPNQDGFNETWNINALNEDLQATIYIFDRYGKLLKQISPRNEGWDGTYNGKQMPSQDYWFRVEFVEPTTGAKSEFKGHFTLKR